MAPILSSKADKSSILYEGRAESSEKGDIPAMMEETWRTRLAAALLDSGKSKRGVSLAAGLNPGYLHSILAEGKDPTIQNLISICDKLGVSMSSILFGFEMTAANEQILQKLEKMPAEKQEGLLKLLGDAPER